MNLTKLIIFTFMGLTCVVSHLTDEEVNPQPCTGLMNNQFVNFYNAKKLDYEFVIDPEIVKNLPCSFKYIEVSRQKRIVIYKEINLGTGGAECHLLLSKSDPSASWAFETSHDIPDYHITCNKFILEEVSNPEKRTDRIFSLLSLMLLKQLREFFVSNVNNNLPPLIIMKMTGLESLQNVIKLNYWGEHFKTQNLYLYNNFKNRVVELVDNQKSLIIKYINIKFKTYQDKSLRNIAFNLLTSKSDFSSGILTTIKKDIHELIINSQSDGLIGSTYVASEINKAESRISETDLFNFLNNFHRKIDKKKDNKWQLTLPNSQIDSLDNLQFLLDNVNKISNEEFLFYLFEEFILFGDEYKAKSNSFINMLLYPISQWYDMPVTQIDRENLTKLALENLWLREDTFDNVTIDTVLKSNNVKLDSSNKNIRFYSVKFSPNNSDECLIVVKRTYINSRDYHEELLLDTNLNYWNQISCFRLTRKLSPTNSNGIYRRRMV